MSEDEDQSVQMEGTHRGKEKAKRKRMPMKKRSAVWNHFILLEDNPNKCMCNYCGKQYQCHLRLDGITNMTRHIKTCESYKTFRAQQSGSQQNLTSEGGEENANNKGFRHFCSVAIPQFVMSSRRTIGSDVMELFLEEKAMLKGLICNNKQRVSLTTDLWTSVQNMSYMVITAHFIDSDWCLNRRIISFSAIEDHRGKSIGLGELHASVTAIRNTVKYVRSSNMRLRTFKQCAEQLMLMTALKFQAAFDRMAEVDKPYEAYFAEKENNVRRANLVDVAGCECDDAFQVSCSFLGYARKVSVQNESRRVVSEVERYLKDPVEDPSNLKLNVLLWWRVNGSRYPILEKITRDVLDVPVSTVASESAFSTRRRIIDEYKSSLTSAMVEALIFTENWLQSKLFANPVYNLQEDIKEQIAYKIASFNSGSGERRHWCYGCLKGNF
ncbi:putative AC transposase [Citrus sinensis]|uniref:AC transposase n=1 Tax=Citrus sinensis TaxID=2711 RepID=A0ACB8L8L3_CITSI|nr:putative AC transposase [Citrus sinensis]